MIKDSQTTIEYVERPLHASELLELVKIADQGRDMETRQAALQVLQRALHPPMIYKGGQIS